MAVTPRLSVIRGGKGKSPAPGKQPTPRSSADEREPDHSANDDSVISLHDGWLRVLERQARSIEP
jgi:hypothetical protein